MPPPKIVADECLDFRIIRHLRVKGYEVLSVLEEHHSLPDEEVLALSGKEQAILITEDSDFGEWVFAHKKKGVGVIFLRYNPDEYREISNALVTILRKYETELHQKFVVIKKNKVRIRDV